MLNFKKRFIVLPFLSVLVSSCGEKNKTENNPTGNPAGVNSGQPTGPNNGGPNGGGTGQSSFTISGVLAINQNLVGKKITTVSGVTHVMAVNPASSQAQRTLAEVVNGKFSLSVPIGRPYVLVFIDSTKVGKAMVVGMFKSQTLDSLAPLNAGGTADLGTVGIDSLTQKASASTPYSSLLASLGLSESAASYLGAVDDLSLRYVNPDIDGNGIIDSLENKSFTIDFHIRSNTFKGLTGNTFLRVDDMTNQYFSASGADVADPRFNLSSAYALFENTYDSGPYTENGSPRAGVSFKYVDSTEHPVIIGNGISFSDLFTSGFGPDFAIGMGDGNLTIGPQLPGSSGTPVDYVYGFNGKTLTFTNVITLTKAQLEGENTIIPFLKFNTAGAGVGSAGQTENITSFSCKWMKRLADKTWVLATADEVKLAVNELGGFVGFTIKGKTERLAFFMPPTPESTISWTAENLAEKTDSTRAIIASPITPNQVCAMAISYDDKLGLRHFVGDAQGNVGVTCN